MRHPCRLAALAVAAVSVLAAPCKHAEKVWDPHLRKARCPSDVIRPKTCHTNVTDPARPHDPHPAGHLSLFDNYFDQPAAGRKKSLVVVTCGAASVDAIDAAVQCWGFAAFDYLLFHYDADLAPYADRPWYARVIGVHAKRQFKFWCVVGRGAGWWSSSWRCCCCWCSTTTTTTTP